MLSFMQQSAFLEPSFKAGKTLTVFALVYHRQCSLGIAAIV
jgi:hypothetical protein